jgi:starvation-inducible DNA-binding protein
VTSAELQSPTDLEANANRDIPAALRALLANVFTLYVKTKNFHWHMSGNHFRDYHLLLDEQSGQIFAMTDDIAQRARKIGGTALRSIGHIAREQRILDNDADYVEPQDMLAELCSDNQQLAREMRRVHELCDEYGDVATASGWKTGSTRLSAGSGSCTKRAAPVRIRERKACGPMGKQYQKLHCASVARRTSWIGWHFLAILPVSAPFQWRPRSRAAFFSWIRCRLSSFQ